MNTSLAELPIQWSKKPDFVLIGAMKAGTTSLYRMLDTHPDLFLTQPKEPEYFSQKFGDDGFYSWYSSLFLDAKPNQLCGECSTGYSRACVYKEVPERLHQENPDVRILYLLRHPAERCWSHYLHRMNERVAAGSKSLPFEEAIKEYPEILDASLFFKQIDRYTNFFPRSQIHVLLFEDLLQDVHIAMEKIFNFLGVSRMVDVKMEHANPAGDLTGRREMRSIWEKAKSTNAGKLAKNFIPKSLARLVYSNVIMSRPAIYLAKNMRGTADIPGKPDQKTRQFLLEYFQSANLELEKWLGRELPDSWNR
ncbi:sulfotransferase family protein [Microbulbifer hainanensis]|uniref:sulfotransferase family protein n=1 Tax=Microbulbifer hainanensis TaxID=2735675 RepID=UPI0018678630|nr:sulfotransferase [Microbulbifer hainanensis]